MDDFLISAHASNPSSSSCRPSGRDHVNKTRSHSDKHSPNTHIMQYSRMRIKVAYLRLVWSLASWRVFSTVTNLLPLIQVSARSGECAADAPWLFMHACRARWKCMISLTWSVSWRCAGSLAAREDESRAWIWAVGVRELSQNVNIADARFLSAQASSFQLLRANESDECRCCRRWIIANAMIVVIGCSCMHSASFTNRIAISICAP